MRANSIDDSVWHSVSLSAARVPPIHCNSKSTGHVCAVGSVLFEAMYEFPAAVGQARGGQKQHKTTLKFYEILSTSAVGCCRPQWMAGLPWLCSSSLQRIWLWHHRRFRLSGRCPCLTCLIKFDFQVLWGGCHVFQHKETCCILLSHARSAWWLETWRNLWNVCMQSWLKVFNRDSSSTLVEILRFFPCRGLSGCLCYLMLSYVVCLILSYCRPEVQQWHLAFGEGLWWNDWNVIKRHIPNLGVQMGFKGSSHFCRRKWFEGRHVWKATSWWRMKPVSGSRGCPLPQKVASSRTHSSVGMCWECWRFMLISKQWVPKANLPMFFKRLYRIGITDGPCRGRSHKVLFKDSLSLLGWWSPLHYFIIWMIEDIEAVS